MSKKVVIAEGEVEQTVQTQAKSNVKANNKSQKPTKKQKREFKLGRRLKETGSELKKVSWPTFPKVVKQTSVVLALVLVFTAVLFGIDQLLRLMFNALV